MPCPMATPKTIVLKGSGEFIIRNEKGEKNEPNYTT